MDGIVNQGKATIENNEVIDNSHYGISTSVMLDSFVGNDLFDNFEYDFHYTAAVDQTAILNYWGTTNSFEIMDNIYDYWDDITFGKVIFEPFATEPVGPPLIVEDVIGVWGSGIWYWDATASTFTQMTTLTGAIDIAAGDFNADGIADVASSWVSGLWYQDGATLGWTKVSDSAPDSVTCGDVTGK
jgi:hypothetical protein